MSSSEARALRCGRSWQRLRSGKQLGRLSRALLMIYLAYFDPRARGLYGLGQVPAIPTPPPRDIPVVPPPVIGPPEWIRKLAPPATVASVVEKIAPAAASFVTAIRAPTAYLQPAGGVPAAPPVSWLEQQMIRGLPNKYLVLTGLAVVFFAGLWRR